MSAISRKIRPALFAKLNVSPVTSLATGGIHDNVAPEGTPLPYVIFARVAPGTVRRNVFGGNINEDDLWMIKALADENSSTTKEAPALAEEIVSACEAAIGDTLTVTGSTVTYVKRERDIPDMAELVNGRHVYHRGFQLRIQAE